MQSVIIRAIRGLNIFPCYLLSFISIYSVLALYITMKKSHEYGEFCAEYWWWLFVEWWYFRSWGIPALFIQ